MENLLRSRLLRARWGPTPRSGLGGIEYMAVQHTDGTLELNDRLVRKNWFSSSDLFRP